MIGKVSHHYVCEMVLFANRMLENAIGTEKFNSRMFILREMINIESTEFIDAECTYIYENLLTTYNTRGECIRAWILTCLSIIPNNRSKCYKMIELGVDQIMIGYAER